MLTKIDKLRARFDYLMQDLSERKSVWDDIRAHLCPHKGEYLTTADRDTTIKRHDKIMNSTPTVALRTLAAGMQGGLTNPAKPWFNLTLRRRELLERPGARQWLQLARDVVRDALARGDFYGASYRVYEELGLFGTDPVLEDEHDENIVTFRTLTAGEYAITCDAANKPNALYRRLHMTVEQMVAEFGLEACSESIKTAYNNDKIYEEFPVIHVIQKREGGAGNGPWKEDMEWESLWFEEKATTEFLRQGGYRTQPFAAPRWTVDGGNVYGTPPSYDALPDVKQLFAYEIDCASAVKVHYKPPMISPLALKSQGGGTIAPGGVNFLDTASMQGYKPAFQIVPNTSEMIEAIARIEHRINRVFYTDLFLAVIDSEREQTAYEVQQKVMEKMTVLGPVVQQLETEFLDVIIKRTFYICVEKRMIPPPPPDLIGEDFTIEYEGMLAQAARATDIAPMETVLRYTAQFANLQAACGDVPDVGDKLDLDQGIDDIARLAGAPADFVRDDVDVARRRQIRQQQRAAAAQQQQLAQAAETAKTAAETPLQGGTSNLLEQLMAARGLSAAPSAR